MADAAGTPDAGNSGDNGAAAQPSFVPTEWASNDDFKGFFKGEGDSKAFDFKALGEAFSASKKAIPVVPETADAYKAEFPKDWPLDEADRKLQREAAKEAGLTQDQYEALVKFDQARFVRAAEESAAEIAAAKDTLQKEWKQDFEANLGKARKVSEMIFGKEFTEASDLGNNPAFIRGLYLLATKMSEDTLKLGALPAGDSRPKTEDGRARLKFTSMGD